MRYRDMPQFVMRRVDTMAAEVNSFLVIIAIGLGMLDLLCLLEKFINAMPPTAMQMVAH